MVLACVSLLVGCKSAKHAPPNIVIIVSDDQGYHDLGCFGATDIKTPHLDKLASQGMKLTSFYVTWPACTPSRGSLLTGRYPQRNGIYDMIRNEAPDYGHEYTPEQYAVTWERIGGMDEREVLLPAMLKKAGYTSGIFGKWDLGMSKRFLPLARGFDDFYGFVNTGIDYYTHERYGVPSMYRNNEPTTEDKGKYATDLFLRESLRFVRANHAKPFFLYVPFNAPHNSSNLDPAIRRTIQAPDEYKAVYPLPEGADAKASRRRDYMAAVTCMDDAIGKLMAELDRLGVADNTIIIFFSDNGGGGGPGNSPLCGGRGRMLEGGLRGPWSVRWPRRGKPGRTSVACLTSLEIVPTLCAAAGVEPPRDVVLDGFDMTPVLSEGQTSPRKEMFWQRRGDMAARVGKWKYGQTPDMTGLYDLSKDISESQDLSSEKPDVLAMMKARLAAWHQAMDEAEPRGPFRDY